MKGFNDLVETHSPEATEPSKNDVIDLPEFHVGVITLGAGQEIPPHPEPYAVFFYVVAGSGEFTGEDGSIELSAGDGLHLEHGERRGIQCTEPLTIVGFQEAH